jgi:hypothetical protein
MGVAVSWSRTDRTQELEGAQVWGDTLEGACCLRDRCRVPAPPHVLTTCTSPRNQVGHVVSEGQHIRPSHQCHKDF